MARKTKLMVEWKKPALVNRPASAAGAPSGAVQLSAHVANSATLDAVDRGIIQILQEDGRAPFTKIAKQLEISEGAVRNRVGQLVEARVLRVIGVADPSALGYDAYAMVGINIVPGHDPEQSALYFRDREEVTYVLFIAGRYDLLIEVICKTHDELGSFLREHCYSRPDVASVEPMIALAMYKNMLKWGQP
jgi:Lrp/AsnC family transcriptional regulator, regulator for asnA, asnC and gidA